MFKKPISFKLFFLSLCFAFLFLLSEKVHATGLVPCGLGTNDPCTLCHFIVGIKGLMDWGMGILVTISIVAIAIAGVMYVVSAGSTTLTTQAKGFVTSTVIGFSLMLSAWLIINTTLWLLSANGDLGLGEGKNWYTFTCSTTSTSTSTTSTTSTAATTTTATVAGFNCDNYSFQTTSIKAQCTNGDASSELQTLITKLYAYFNNDSKAIMINSISDNNGGASCYKSNPTWTQCAKDSDTNCCHHGTNSCHYGGTTCAGKSYAIDIGTGSTASSSDIKAAANTYANYVVDEGDHIHVSVGSSCGCK